MNKLFTKFNNYIKCGDFLFDVIYSLKYACQISIISLIYLTITLLFMYFNNVL